MKQYVLTKQKIQYGSFKNKGLPINEIQKMDNRQIRLNKHK